MLIKPELNRLGHLQEMVDDINRRSLSKAHFSIRQEDHKVYLNKYSQQISRMKWQYNWLNHHQNHPFIPKTKRPTTHLDGFSYDIQYILNGEALSLCLKNKSKQEYRSFFEKILISLKTNIYNQKCPTSLSCLDSYLEEKFKNNIEKIQKRYANIAPLFSEKTITLNNEISISYFDILNKMKSFASQKQAHKQDPVIIHGDLTTDNILLSPLNSFFFIDPIPSQHYSQPVVDLSKLLLSLDPQFKAAQPKNIKINESHISFFSENSYKEIAQDLTSIILEHFPEVTRDELIFHQLIHLARILPYSLSRSLESSQWYMAKLISLGTQFLDQ